MFTDISNSIKAKLYDFTYTPFMSSVLLSWIVINHKYLLIYFGNSKLKEKLTLLNDYNSSVVIMDNEIPYSLNFLLPIIFGLFYVFIYPWISKVFYEYTLERTKALKVIKQEIEDETPITQEEARGIREDIDRLRDARDEARSKLRSTEEEYQQKLDNHLEPLQSALKKANEETNEFSSKIKDLEHQFSQSKEFLEKKNNDYNELEKRYQESKQYTDNQKSSVVITPELDIKEHDKTKILRYFYESNYKPLNESSLLDSIVHHTKLARPKAKKIIDELLNNNILRIEGSYKKIKITDKGNDILLDIFDKDS